MPSGESIQSPMFSFSYPFFNRGKKTLAGALGISILNDNIAKLLVTNGVMAGFAYRFQIKKTYLNLGLQGGFFQRAINLNNIITDSQILTGIYDPNAGTNENFTNNSVTYPAFNLGVFWFSNDDVLKDWKYFFGVSYNNLNQPKIAFQNETQDNMPANINVMGGLRVYKRYNFSIIPNFRLINRLNNTYTNIGAWLKYYFNGTQNLLKDGNISLGTWYNTNKALVFSVEFNNPKYFVAINYDLPLGNSNSTWQGNSSFEISLGIKLKRKIKDKKPKDTNTVITDTNNLVSDINMLVSDSSNVVSGVNKVVLDFNKVVSDINKTAIQDTIITIQDTNIITDTIKVEVKLDTVSVNASLEFQDTNIQFDFDEVGLSDSAENDLNYIMNIMMRNPNLKIEIIGYTCDKETDSDILSRRRANAVKLYLAQLGIESDRMFMIISGTKNPVVPNDSEENRKQNRRVEIKVKK